MITLLTTQKEYEDLHRRSDTRAKTMRVDAQTLTNLLIDHSVLVRAARDKGLRIKEPQEGLAKKK